jgi:hypothetical protein
VAPKTDLVGVLDRIRWRSPDSPWLLASLEDGTTITGNAAEGELFPGITYQFFGAWEEHSKFGKQFKFVQFVKQEPHSRHGLVCYLVRYAPGVGAGIAGQLFDKFGSLAVQVLRTQPEAAAREVPRLTLTKAKEASECLKRLAALEDTKIELTNLFAGRGFPGRLVDDVIRKAGILAPAIIRRNPFWLLVNGFGGCGFARCDRLYSDLGLPQDNLKRQVICLWHLLRDAKGNMGHTWVDGRAAWRRLAEAVGGVEVNVSRAVRLGERSGWIARRVDAAGAEWLAEGKRAANESFLAGRIRELLEGGHECS